MNVNRVQKTHMESMLELLLAKLVKVILYPMSVQYPADALDFTESISRLKAHAFARRDMNLLTAAMHLMMVSAIVLKLFMKLARILK